MWSVFVQDSMCNDACYVKVYVKSHKLYTCGDEGVVYLYLSD